MGSESAQPCRIPRRTSPSLTVLSRRQSWSTISARLMRPERSRQAITSLIRLERFEKSLGYVAACHLFVLVVKHQMHIFPYLFSGQEGGHVFQGSGFERSILAAEAGDAGVDRLFEGDVQLTHDGTVGGQRPLDGFGQFGIVARGAVGKSHGAGEQAEIGIADAGAGIGGDKASLEEVLLGGADAGRSRNCCRRRF